MPDESPSAFCHIVIPAPDLAKAQVFYERVFGWKVQPNIPGAKYGSSNRGTSVGPKVRDGRIF